MKDLRKPHRYQVPDNFASSKPDKIAAQFNINKKNLNDS